MCWIRAAPGASWPRRWRSAGRKAQVTGIDPAKDAIDVARAHARAGGLRIGYDVGLGEALPDDTASFDAVVCVDVLEHVSDLDTVRQRSSALCAPAGCSCSTPSTATRWRGLPPS